MTARRRRDNRATEQKERRGGVGMVNKSPVEEQKKIKKEMKKERMDNTENQSLVRCAPVLTLLLLFGGMALIACAGAPGPDTDRGLSVMQTYQSEARNTPRAEAVPYVVLLSIDGYRHDYNRIHQPPNLIKIAAEGVAAESLIPIYPSKTFPNHYSIATGLYADEHGIVSNEFYDPTRNAVYSLSDRKAVEDGTWYTGEPLWLAISKQGMLTASYFWVGSEANVQGGYPNYYYRYDASVPPDRRVDQVLEWLRLPPDRRPHFITLYFDGVDKAGHKFGPRAPQTREAVLAVDAVIGRLREGLVASGLPVNLIIVSDHGMEELDPKKVILLDDIPGVAGLLPKFRVHGRGPQMQLYLNQGESPSALRELEGALEKNAKHFRVLRRDELKSYHYDSNPRTGDLNIEPDPPYLVGIKAQPPNVEGGNHGWDPRKSKAMHGIFYAIGPSFKSGYKLKSFENVHIYPLVLETLGLKPLSKIDGRLAVVKGTLKTDRRIVKPAMSLLMPSPTPLGTPPKHP